MTETVTLRGEQFTVASEVGSLALMRFAKLAQSGVDALDLAGLAALYDLLEQCIDPDDWSAFCDHANRHRVTGDDLLVVVQEVFALLAARPTLRPSVSSDGPRIIEPTSTVDSSSPVIARLNDQGRPDLALIVRKREESLTA